MSCWFKDPSINHTGIAIIGTSLFLIAGKHVIPKNIVKQLKDDSISVIFLLIIFYFANLRSLPAIGIAISLLVLYVGIQGSLSHEPFCPYTAESVSLPQNNAEEPERCNYSIHPDMQEKENVPTLVSEPEWEASQPQTEQRTEDFNFTPYTGMDDGADFNASFD